MDTTRVTVAMKNSEGDSRIEGWVMIRRRLERCRFDAVQN